MSRERLLRGERSGRERDAHEPFDWRDLAEQYGLSARDAMHLWDEAGLRAGSFNLSDEQERVFVELLQEVSGSRPAPAPGKFTRTAAHSAGQPSGRRRSSRHAAVPGKVALTSYLSAEADPDAGTDHARALVKPDAGARDPAILIDRARRRAERIEVPMRREMEEELGVSLGHVLALAGSAAEEALAALDAAGAAIDHVVLFGSRHPDRIWSATSSPTWRRPARAGPPSASLRAR